MTEKWHQVTKITLPSSKAKVQIVWNDAREAMVSLLSDPRITDEDYLFFENNPLSTPPDNLNYVADLNTGRAYTKTFRKLVKVPGKQTLLPVIFYIDAANTGQFADLPVTAVKFTLGIFTRKAREKDYLWRTLGYIPAFLKFKSKGRRLMLNSLHVDAVMAHADAGADEGLDAKSNINPAQDFHTMLEVVLKSYVKLQETGFIWDLFYQNTWFKGIEFILFTPFMKVDSEEGDKLCGKYLARMKGVKQLCRYCECPLEKSDSPLADYPLKKKRKIMHLINENDEEALKNLSQQKIQNSMYAIRFGLHNKQGVHGACPFEMLHMLLLGVFKYVRDVFFERLGNSSEMSNAFNALSKEYGSFMSRQSDRDFPVTRFANGIKRGKLMAQEYPRILLCMAAVLRSTQGRDILSRRKEKFGTPEVLRDWSQLVETLLQWERWLRSDTMEKSHVKKARDKHRYIMYLMKSVAPRQSGMGLKLLKFHAIVHLADHMLIYGVPMEVDTGSNESGHKATKKAAKLTQRNEATFDYQTAMRLEEVHLIDLAIQEIAGRAPFNYGELRNSLPTENPNTDNISIGGAKYHMKYVEEKQEYVAIIKSDTKEEGDEKLEKDLINFIAQLAHLVKPHINCLYLRTKHTRNGQVFRAHNKF
jgi:hypothetical protein